MTRDLDTLLRDADPLRGRSDDDAALLLAARARVDRERAGAVPAPARHRRWSHRLTLVAAAAAVITAVPLVLSVLGGDDGPPALVPPAVAANGEITCGTGYATAVDPGDASVRLLPGRLPTGWSYTKIFAREETTAGTCIPPSLTALHQDPEGRVTGRIAVTGPVDAHVDQGRIVAGSVPDTLFGHEARRFHLQPVDVVFHRWFWTDDEGRQWSVEASGMPLEEARRELSAVSINGSDVAWNGAAAPGWTLVHLREGAPYGIVGQLNWYVEMTDGTGPRMVQVGVLRGATVPLLALTGVGETVTTVGGHPAVLSQMRTSGTSGSAETDVPPGAVTRPVLVEVVPGTVAWSWSVGDDLPQVQELLASLRQADAEDPRLARYGTE